MFKRKVFTFLGVLAFILLVLFLHKYAGDKTQNNLVLSGTIESHEVYVGSKVGGRITKLLVDEGAAVAPRQIIAQFDVYDLPAKRKQLAAAVQSNFDQLEKLKHGPRPQEIDQARAALNSAQAAYQNALDTFKRYQQLYRRDEVSQEDYENKKTALQQADAARKSSAQQLELLEAGTRVEDIAAAKAALKEAQANLQAIDTQLEELVVRSPSPAIVETLDIRPGDLITPNTPIATLLLPSELYINVYIPETKLGLARLGNPVEIRVDSFPNKIFHGTIEQIASQGEFTPKNVQTYDDRTHEVFAVKIKPDNSEGLLHAGMNADVSLK